jgi:outer membrane protein assembly factor BamB
LKNQLQLIGADKLNSPELLLVRTLDGTVHALDKETGHKQWAFQDEPVLNVASENEGVG